ncbi:MAG TPA: hypothetical protein VNR65_10325 [Geobacterales bacterium]|nr:hypothetical protein [Geobacterales bacterium]
MAEYRVHIVDQDSNSRKTIRLECDNDDDAKGMANQLVNGLDVELWQRGRLIAKFQKSK